MEEKNYLGQKECKEKRRTEEAAAETSASGNGAFADTQGRER
jgi:hypothetical protein